MNSFFKLQRRFNSVQSFSLNNLKNYEVNFKNFTSKVLTKYEDIFEARRLHYEMAVESNYPLNVKNDPSGIKVDVVDDFKIIKDNFEENSFWVGAFHNNEKMVSIARCIYRTKTHPLETETFMDSKKPKIQKILQSKRQLAEISRAYTIQKYRGYGLNYLNLSLLFSILVATDHDLIFTSELDQVDGIGTLLDNNFVCEEWWKYSLFYFSQDDMKKSLQLYNEMKKKL